jgi:hypothetical protein
MVETPKLGVSTSSHPDAQIGRLYIISPRRPKLTSLHHLTQTPKLGVSTSSHPDAQNWRLYILHKSNYLDIFSAADCNVI